MTAVSPVPPLVGLYWTLAGPVEVATGREWSLFDFRDRCEEAARAGFRGIGLWHADLEHVMATRSLGEMRQILDDNGLEYLELEFLTDWFLGPGDGRRDAADARRRLLLAASAALGAHHIKVGNLFGRACPVSQIADEFARLCAEAAQQTTARIVYEFMPFDASVHSIDMALAVVAGAGADNGGIAIDTWHMGKLRIAPGDLARIPPRFLAWIELSDGRAASMPDLSDETLNHRELPGEGELGVGRYVAAGLALGYGGPWGVEVLSARLRSLPMPEMYRRAYQATAAQFLPSHAPSPGRGVSTREGA
ncbi:MAG TPA: TIM barrel protein [Streptosporangiaceae bacterium]|nr:TIM barrel protein [Streptosporangiaceae bacterium]